MAKTTVCFKAGEAQCCREVYIQTSEWAVEAATEVTYSSSLWLWVGGCWVNVGTEIYSVLLRIEDTRGLVWPFAIASVAISDNHLHRTLPTWVHLSGWKVKANVSSMHIYLNKCDRVRKWLLGNKTKLLKSSKPSEQLSWYWLSLSSLRGLKHFLWQAAPTWIHQPASVPVVLAASPTVVLGSQVTWSTLREALKLWEKIMGNWYKEHNISGSAASSAVMRAFGNICGVSVTFAMWWINR